MIEPILKGQRFLDDVAAAPREDGRFRLWWLGQSGFLVAWRGRHILLDPYLSDSLTKKYANTDKPHIRMTAPVAYPARLDFIDVVTSSHSHTDHLDPETLQPLSAANPGLTLVAPEAIRELARQRSGLPDGAIRGLSNGESVEIGEFRFTAIDSAHERVERDANGKSLYLGYVVQFGPWTLYHSGDTMLHDGLVPALRQFRIDVALLPINGRAPERRVAGNLDAREAVWLAQQTAARTVIPCHYEMFTFNTADPREFAALAREAGQPHHVLRCGERWEPALL